jgi:hypothetical protein
MRKITQEACHALLHGNRYKRSNTRVEDGVMYLFDNAIATKSYGNLYICDGGHKSVTTKERLNGLHGVEIKQKRGVWYLNGVEWDGRWVKLQDIFKTRDDL